jgi:hypothetical protein
MVGKFLDDFELITELFWNLDAAVDGVSLSIERYVVPE